LPTFWEFPTVSMGLGPINAVYQARFNRYLYNRELVDTSKARVWCYLGDGELDHLPTCGSVHELLPRASRLQCQRHAPKSRSAARIISCATALHLHPLVHVVSS
jgi:hypothetical protein